MLLQPVKEIYCKEKAVDRRNPHGFALRFAIQRGCVNLSVYIRITTELSAISVVCVAVIVHIVLLCGAKQKIDDHEGDEAFFVIIKNVKIISADIECNRMFLLG